MTRAPKAPAPTTPEAQTLRQYARRLDEAILDLARGGDDLMTASITKLGEYWDKLIAMYDKPGGVWVGAATLHPECLGTFAGELKSVKELVPLAVERCAKALGA